ncbi:MAG: metallophosphoesterase [Actinomycetota bacterium]|nr:metallophosphoesterase [Actinomycetota bacterium]
MPRILHISDPHLGKPERWQYLGDDKLNLFGKRTTQDVLKDTLKAFGNSPEAENVDAVVLSGDVTNRARDDGYKELQSLQKLLPVDSSKIVVVPGNHDVVWDSPEGSETRYASWRKYVRAAGYVTPLLDGIDFKADGALEPPSADRMPVLEGNDFVIVALNSSNFCGVVEGATGIDWDKALKYKVRQRDAIKRAIKGLRQHDVPRISTDQMRALVDFLRAKDPLLLEPESDPRIRIAVLHHHLLPVSTSEEVKTFESIVNLGEVRLFLRNLGFHVVLHGHKHQPALYFDYQAPYDAPLGPGQRRTAVAAAPGLFDRGKLTMRVLDFHPRAESPRGARPQEASAPLLDIRDVEGLAPSDRFKFAKARTVDLWRSDMETEEGPFVAIYGDSREDVYERLQSTFERYGPGAELSNVLCVVRSPQSADESTLPSGYPPVDDSDEADWFRSMVDWWQKADSEVLGRSKATAFNHGQRIFGPGWNPESDGKGSNAVTRAADVLHAEPDTTRAIAVLVDPRTEAGRLDTEFPAFVVVQLRLVPVGDGMRLDCLGYFRKQDVRHWWPVNVAELARIQRQVQELLGGKGTLAERGHIITFAATALVDGTLPSLNIARIDRAVDDVDGRAKILRMAYAIFHPEEPGGDQAGDLWREMFADLYPPADGSGTGRKVASVGIDELLTRLKDLRYVISDSRGDAVIKLVESMRTSFRAIDEVPGADLRADLFDALNNDAAALLIEVDKRLRTIDKQSE